MGMEDGNYLNMLSSICINISKKPLIKKRIFNNPFYMDLTRFNKNFCILLNPLLKKVFLKLHMLDHEHLFLL